MTRHFLARIAIALSVAAALGSSAQAAHPAPNGPLDPQLMRGPPEPSALGVHKLKSMYETTGGAITVPAFNQTPVDAITQVKCPSPGPCTIVAETSTQVHGSTAGNRWSICTYVDGVIMKNSCLFQGNVPTGAVDYVIGGNRAHLSLTGGMHQVQSFAYMEGGGQVVTFQYDYSVFIP